MSGNCVTKYNGTGGAKICCDTACNGMCDGNACDSGGACHHIPVSARQQCGMIQSTGNHSYSDAVYLLCDGQGGCSGPTFKCGNSTTGCTLSSTQACCNQTYTDPATYCIAEAACYISGPPSNSESCKDTLDCPSNMVCCKVEGYGFRGEFCSSSCDRSVVDPTNSIPNVNQACDPTRSNGGTCPTGQSCAIDGDGNSEGICG
jgi:hypothetical protein